jgi:hypothetical protein
MNGNCFVHYKGSSVEKLPWCANCRHFGEKINARVGNCNLHGRHMHEDDRCDSFERPGTVEVAPPIGVKPKYIHDEERFADLAAATARYVEAGLRVPKEWIDEMWELSRKWK